MAAFTPTIGTNAGNWRPIGWPATPAFDPDGWVGNLKPFVIESQSQFRSDGPNALTSAEYAKDYNEVKELGALNSTKRTADQTTAAVFWQFPPAALYNRLARELAAPNRYGLDTFKQARLYAMVNLAMADGATSCWNDKYHWAFWRPRAAIREGETDGNAGDDRRSHVGVALPPVDGRRAGDAALPRPPVGARLRERRGPADVPGVLRNGQGRVRHPLGPVPEPAAALRPVLARAEGSRRRARSGAGSTSGRPTCREP